MSSQPLYDLSRKDLSSDFRKKNPALINPLIDFLMVGGLSILFFAGMHVFRPLDSNTNALAWTMFYVSFVINSPHFLISYQHFYGDHRKRLFQDWKWMGTAFVVPALLIAWLAWGAFMEDMSHLGLTVNAMFFFVGWHYVKQIFGCFVVSSARAKYKISAQLRTALRGNLYALWSMSYINGNRAINEFDFYSLKYGTFAAPSFVVNFTYVATAVTACWVLKEFASSYVRQERWPPLTALTAWVAIYVWYIPAFSHPAYFLMIPAFHSLQYLLFSWPYTKNRIKNASLVEAKEKSAQRSYFVRRCAGYIALSFLLGALCFKFVPEILDGSLRYNRELIGVTFFMACFQLFINIHHYFIDHLIWRGNLPEVKRNLLDV